MPEWHAALRARLAHLRLPPAQEASIVEELSQHLEDRRRELISSGVEPDRATAMANAELERTDLLAARLGALRQARLRPAPVPGVATPGPFAGVWQDVRYAWRSLRRDPFVALVAVLTLSFGIGLNTSMFGFMNGLLFRPLPFPDAHRLVRLFRTTPENRYGGFSPADYLFLKQAEGDVARFAAYQPANLTLPDGDGSTGWLRVSANLFDVLGLQPALGRSFRAEDDRRGHERVVLISTAFWQERFGGSNDAIGRMLHAGGEAYEVIGVLPPSASDHRLFARTGVFSPLGLDDAAWRDHRTRTLTVLGRRGPGTSEAQAEAFIVSIGARVAADFPADNVNSTWRTEGLPASNTGPTGQAILAMLLGLSLFVLLIACSNLANVLLARAIDRAREFAVRTALGASRLYLIRAVTLESVLLAAGGGAGALLIATWTTRWLQSVVVDGGGPAIPMDWRVLTFASAGSIATVFLCGLAPALFARRLNTNDTLKSGARGLTAARGHVRLRSAFMVLQFTLAMVLLAAAAFFVRGIQQMISQEYGWSADRVVQGEIELPRERYPEDSDVIAFQQRAIERLMRIPDVEAASVSYGLPYMGLRGIAHYVGDADEAGPAVTARINGITPSYFEVTRTRLIAGRIFATTDTHTSPRVAIISDSMARRLFGNRNAVGRRVAAASTERGPWMEVVGVVSDVRSIDFAQEPAPHQLYQPTTQDPRRGLMLALRTATGRPAAIVPAVQAAVAELDPDLTARRLATATARMREVTTSMSLVTRLLSGFAVLGLLLSALGIYGAMARMVVQRTDEIGLRMALGARARHALGLVFASGGRLVALGIAFGLAGAFGLSRLLASVFPGMQIDSGIAGLSATGILAAAALLACYLPARRAARIDPIVALRRE